MDPSTWAAFVATSAALLVIPGPTVALVVSHALSAGGRAAAPLAFGVLLGHLTAMTLSLLGMGAVLASSETLFLGLRSLGAAYLVVLGLRLWLAPRAPGGGPAVRTFVEHRLIWQAWLVTAINPLSLMFFIAFLPQFFDPERSFPTQMLIFEVTFLALAFANSLCYAMLAGRAGRVTASTGLLRTVRAMAGTMLSGAAGITFAGS
jgi:threonine/homoserine/homoserine lactone efflux protein